MTNMRSLTGKSKGFVYKGNNVSRHNLFFCLFTFLVFKFAILFSRQKIYIFFQFYNKIDHLEQRIACHSTLNAVIAETVTAK